MVFVSTSYYEAERHMRSNWKPYANERHPLPQVPHHSGGSPRARRSVNARKDRESKAV